MGRVRASPGEAQQVIPAQLKQKAAATAAAIFKKQTSRCRPFINSSKMGI